MPPAQPFDWYVPPHLVDDNFLCAYLSAMFEEGEGDSASIIEAIGGLARHRGMTQLSHRTGLSRESLYKTFSASGNPSFVTVHKVLFALGFRLLIVDECDHRPASKGRPYG